MIIMLSPLLPEQVRSTRADTEKVGRLDLASLKLSIILSCLHLVSSGRPVE